MDCHDIRVLLALWRREGAIDPTERAALQQHLDACPDCAAHSHSEQVVDAALGQAMRAVTVPAGMHERVLTRLAAVRPRRWPKVAAVAAAAMLLLAVGTTWWVLNRRTPVDWDIAVNEVTGRQEVAPDDVEQWYAERGIDMATWRQLDHRYLWTFDIVEFRGRRVPKLIFYKEEQGGIMEVLVLPASQFDTHDLQSGELNAQSRISVAKPGTDYVYLIATNAAASRDTFMLNAH
jgi:anti-sigma factor (TIGR02949 family)